MKLGSARSAAGRCASACRRLADTPRCVETSILEIRLWQRIFERLVARIGKHVPLRIAAADEVAGVFGTVAVNRQSSGHPPAGSHVESGRWPRSGGRPTVQQRLESQQIAKEDNDGNDPLHQRDETELHEQEQGSRRYQNNRKEPKRIGDNSVDHPRRDTDADGDEEHARQLGVRIAARNNVQNRAEYQRVNGKTDECIPNGSSSDQGNDSNQAT